MAAQARAAAQPQPLELVITRVFDAPRRLVFKAWTELDHASEWWAPKGCLVTSLVMDVRPGGVWRKCMRAPDGREYWREGVYREVVEPERLVFTYVTDDPGSPPGHETLVEVTFEEQGPMTRLTLRQTGFETPASRDNHAIGWNSTADRFGEHLAQAFVR